MKKRKPGSRVTTFILIFIFLVGLSVLCYPSISNWWNSRVQSYAIASYSEAVSAMSEEEYAAILEAAYAYNEELYNFGSSAALAAPEKLEGYEEILDITGTGIMGYITIDKLNIELPVYHGTGSGVLSMGAGHLEGSSFPVGGENTHAVISAHRGLPRATLFTHLDQLEEGDTFTITVLDEILTYQVDQIAVVLPSEYEELYIREGEDCCTLMTCTPYGINTHRLLVRGIRIDTPDTGLIHVVAEAYRIDSVLTAAVAAILLLVILMGFLLVRTRRKKRIL